MPEEQARFRRAIFLAVPFGANIGGVGAPIGTPPNVIAYATGEIPSKSMAKVGFLIGLFAVVVLMALYQIYNTLYPAGDGDLSRFREFTALGINAEIHAVRANTRPQRITLARLDIFVHDTVPAAQPRYAAKTR